jgi:hypothetical protein
MSVARGTLQDLVNSFFKWILSIRILPLLGPEGFSPLLPLLHIPPVKLYDAFRARMSENPRYLSHRTVIG